MYFCIFFVFIIHIFISISRAYIGYIWTYLWYSLGIFIISPLILVVQSVLLCLRGMALFRAAMTSIDLSVLPWYLYSPETGNIFSEKKMQFKTLFYQSYGAGDVSFTEQS